MVYFLYFRQPTYFEEISGFIYQNVLGNGNPRIPVREYVGPDLVKDKVNITIVPHKKLIIFGNKQNFEWFKKFLKEDNKIDLGIPETKRYVLRTARGNFPNEIF